MMSAHDTAATLEPHQLSALLKPPTQEAQINYVVQHCNCVLPQLAADSLTTSSLTPTFTCLPSSAALQSYLAELTTSHKHAADRTAKLESQLRQQLLSNLSGVKNLRQRLASLPDDIASTEDKLLDLCEDLVIDSASSAPGTSRDAENTLMNRLDQLHAAIEQLTKAKHYFSILAQGEDLRLAVIQADQDDGKRHDALDKLAELDTLVRRVEKLSTAAAGGQGGSAGQSEPNMVAFLRAQRSAAFKTLRKARCTRLSEAISSAGFHAGAQPTTDKHMPPLDTAASAENLITNQAVNHAWADVCQLQDTAERLSLLRRATAKPSSTRIRGGNKVTAGSDEYQPLLATQCLVEPMLLRFRYHFDGDRSTNRLDKPEWFMSHIAALIKSQSPLFEPAVHGQPGSGGVVARLNRKYANADIASRKPWRYIGTQAELLHGLLTPLRRKIASTMPALLDHPSLLAHTVFQALTFDADLAETFPASVSVLEGQGTRKVSDDILGNAEWFNRWLDGEKAFALERFEQVMDSADAWAIGSSDSLADDDEQIFYPSTTTLDSSSGGETGQRTTKSARSVVEILESVSERYGALPSVSQRLSFVALVQLPILRSYAQRLTRSLDAFESLSSAFARAMPGEIVAGTAPASLVSLGTDSDMVKGLRGLGRLVKALLSAHHVVVELERWSETATFVELAEALAATEEGRLLAVGLRRDEGRQEDRELDAASLGMLLRRGLKRGAAVARPLAGAAQTAERYKETVGDKVKVDGVDDAGYGVWDEPRRKFGEICTRADTAIERLVVSETLELLRPYVLRRWDEEASSAEEHGEAEAIPTPALIASLSVFSSHLSHLSSILNREMLLLVYRHIANSISSALVDRVVMAGGSRRFTLDGALRFSQDLQQGWLGVVGEVASSKRGVLGRNPHAPWKQALDTARLLTLPSSTSTAAAAGAINDADKVTLAKAVQIVFDAAEQAGKDSQYTELIERLGVDDTKLNVREVLRRRVEVWK